MKANAQPLSETLFANTQFIVPFFQRSYSWDRPNWERLATDIQNLEKQEPTKKHFLGPLVCALLSATPGTTPQYQLIDGQQRLTTLSLILLAIRDVARENKDNELAAEIQETYLIHRFKKGLDRFKLIPRTGDRELFCGLIEEKAPKSNESSRLTSGYIYFLKLVRQLTQGKGDSLRQLFDIVVNRLYMVVITLTEEDPYEIFESLNSTGLPLQESDLIRNFLFMQIPLPEQADFQDQYWLPFEKEFELENANAMLSATGFYRDFLMQNGKYSKAKETFSDFKTYFNENNFSPATIVEKLQRAVRHAKTIIEGGDKKATPVAKVLRHFSKMDASTANPVVIKLLGLLESNHVTEQEFIECIHDLNSFIIRRSIVGDSTRPYGKWFCELAGQITTSPRQQMQGYLLHRGWPDDEVFEKRLIEFPIYNREQKKCRLILEALERFDGFKEKVILDKDVQIEHVMPQKMPKGEGGLAWQSMLGADCKVVHRRWLHTLGNLTLTAYNPKLSNRAFIEKRNELKESKLTLNEYFAGIESWNELEIKKRAKKLAEQVSLIWKRPNSDFKYIAPSRTPGSDNKTKERRRGYWKSLINLLEQSEVSTRPTREFDGSICQFFLPIADVSLFCQVLPAKKQLTVTLAFARPRGKEIFRRLSDELRAQRNDFLDSCSWISSAKPTIMAVLPGVSIRDPLDWHEQHRWIIKVLREIEIAVIPSVKLLSHAVKEKSASRQFFLDYWLAFNQMLFERKSTLCTTTALPQHWKNFSIGKSGVWIDALVNRTASRMSVVLNLGTKVSRAFFPELKKERVAIEEEMQTKLEWHNPESKKQWRIEISKTDVPFDDRANWKEQHEWLIAKAELFERVFRQRVQQL